VCVSYTKDGKEVGYRPDQLYLNTVSPSYKEFKPWDVSKTRKARTYQALPKEAKIFLDFIEQAVGQKIIMITTGPKRNEYLKLA
jgi:adenylosuccinate synthase